MAPTLVKTTGKTLKKTAQYKAITKTAKGARKTATKAVKGTVVAKAAKKAADNVGERTRKGAALEHLDAQARANQVGGGHQAVVPRADHRDVERHPFTTPSGRSRATRPARPARSTTRTTRSTSL